MPAPLPWDFERTMGRGLGVPVAGVMPSIVRGRQAPDEAAQTGIPWPADADGIVFFADAGDDSFTDAAQAIYETAWPNTGRWNVHADAYLGSATAVVPSGGAIIKFTVTLGIPGVTGLTSRSYPLGLPEGSWSLSGLQFPVDCFDDTAEQGDDLDRYLGLTVSASGSTSIGGVATLSITGESRT